MFYFQDDKLQNEGCNAMELFLQAKEHRMINVLEGRKTLVRSIDDNYFLLLSIFLKKLNLTIRLLIVYLSIEI